MDQDLTDYPEEEILEEGVSEEDGKDHEPLHFIQPRDTKRVRAERSPTYSRFVLLLRVFLPVGALFVLGALIVWPMISSHKIMTSVLKNIPDLVIDNLHLTGLDSQNQPYSLNALKATRPSGSSNIYDLEKPEGEITLKTGAWVAGKAQYGRYDMTTRRLWLGGDVHLFHDKGYQFTTNEAQLDMRENYAWGESPVLIQGFFGEIRGQGFRLLDGGHTMVVKGPAHAVLSLRSSQASDKPTVSP